MPLKNAAVYHIIAEAVVHDTITIDNLRQWYQSSLYVAVRWIDQVAKVQILNIHFVLLIPSHITEG